MVQPVVSALEEKKIEAPPLEAFEMVRTCGLWRLVPVHFRVQNPTAQLASRDRDLGAEKVPKERLVELLHYGHHGLNNLWR